MAWETVNGARQFVYDPPPDRWHGRLLRVDIASMFAALAPSQWMAMHYQWSMHRRTDRVAGSQNAREEWARKKEDERHYADLKRCLAKTANGNRCRRTRLQNSVMCGWHTDR